MVITTARNRFDRCSGSGIGRRIALHAPLMFLFQEVGNLLDEHEHFSGSCSSAACAQSSCQRSLFFPASCGLQLSEGGRKSNVG
jgi:hypothetical protein